MPDGIIRLADHRSGAFVSLGTLKFDLGLNQLFGKFRNRNDGSVGVRFPDAGENGPFARISGGDAKAV